MMKTKDIAIIGIMSSVMITLQLALSFLPNIELVSLMVVLCTLMLGWRTLFIIYVFVIAEGLMFGFGLWWISYLYVWTILYIIATFFKNNKSPYFWALVSAGFGLAFGALCSIPYILIGGFPMALAFWIGGIPFDIVHCISNFIIALVLFKPLQRIYSNILAQ